MRLEGELRVVKDDLARHCDRYNDLLSAYNSLEHQYRMLELRHQMILDNRLQEAMLLLASYQHPTHLTN